MLNKWYGLVMFQYEGPGCVQHLHYILEKILFYLALPIGIVTQVDFIMNKTLLGLFYPDGRSTWLVPF